MSTDILSAAATARFLGHCDTCDRPVAGIVEDTRGDHAPVACPDCGTPCPAQRLYGTMTVAHCNSACEGARGPHCECACSGANHGGAWAKPGTMLADELAAYRTDKTRRAARAQKRRDARRVARQDSFTLWTATHTDIVEWLAVDGNVAWSDFLAGIADRVQAGEELSIDQLAAVRKAMTRQADRDAVRAAEAALPVTPVVAGKGVEIVGEVIKVDVKDNPYGYGSRRVMTVRDDRGFKVWGTVPSALTDEVALSELTGRRVRFAANVTAGDLDPAFGFFKTPRRAEVLALAETAAS